MPATIEIPTTRPGRTLTLSAFPDGSDTAAFTEVALTEASNRPGVYSFSNDTATGLHLLIAYENGTPVWQSWAVLETSGTVIASETREAALLAQSINSAGEVAISSEDRDALLTAIGTPLQEEDYVAPSSAESIASAVWAATTRTLTAFGFTVNTNANAVEESIKSLVETITAKLPSLPYLAGSSSDTGTVEVDLDLSDEQAANLAATVLEGLGLEAGQRVATPGDLHVILGPVTARTPADVVQNTIFLRLDDTSEYRIEQITGVDGEPVDLTAFDSLDLLFETRNKQQLEVLDVTVINDGVGFKFRPSTMTVGMETQAQSPHLWSLRNPDDVGETGQGRVICGGPLVVTRFATRRGT